MTLMCVLIFLNIIAISQCKYCWHKNGFGKSTHFYCSAFQYCCGDQCCENINEFYKLWYFWLCVLVILASLLMAIYWLRRRYTINEGHNSRSRYRQSGRRYRQLTGESNASVLPAVVMPQTVVTTPPPYLGDNSVCPHGGPPPYTLGSGSSINSTNLSQFPPSYNDIEKMPPPSYDEFVVTDLNSYKLNTQSKQEDGDS